jgi:hypothetical protein
LNWWDDALFDTCSLITVDKILLDHPDLSAVLPCMSVVRESFTADHLRPETANRARHHCRQIESPSATELALILGGAHLSKSISDVDLVVYATAVHRRLCVVTGDRDLAKAIQARGLAVGNCAMILRDLVLARAISVTRCETILSDLASRDDFIISGGAAQSWHALRNHRFP